MAGFVDLQVNGWRGIDFSAPGLTVEDVHRVTRWMRECGTAMYCPTIMTRRIEIYRENLAVIADAMEDGELGGHIAGIHFEALMLWLKGLRLTRQSPAGSQTAAPQRRQMILKHD